MEDQKLWRGLALNQDFAIGKELKPKAKMSKLRNMLSKLVERKCITVGGLGAAEGWGSLGVEAPPATGRFLEKITILMSLNLISHVFRAISKNYNFNI